MKILGFYLIGFAVGVLFSMIVFRKEYKDYGFGFWDIALATLIFGLSSWVGVLTLAMWIFYTYENEK